MPELPETETIARDLNARVPGARIVGVQVWREDVLRGVSAADLASRVSGQCIWRVWRRAKLIVLDLGRANKLAGHIVVQPRFTGGVLVDDGTLPAELREYLTVSFMLEDRRQLHYRDVRRLGTLAWMLPGQFDAYAGALGPEPLGDGFSSATLRESLGDSTRVVKAALMDQTKLAGVGNIYATEALWDAGIDPSRATRSLSTVEWHALHEALQRILAASIEARGTSFRDYRDASGGRGAYVGQLRAYGREGQPCVRCGRRLIGTHAIDGRNTVFCAGCQC